MSFDRNPDPDSLESHSLPADIVVGESYRIKCLLGKGGMGNVYLAEQIIIGKQYALKMLAPEQVTEENWNRFQNEGKAIARMDHPNIVKVYNMGLDKSGMPFYVMDLLPGDSLQDLLKSGELPDFDSLLGIFLQIASALEYSHSRGVIHRDVKPSNVMLKVRGKSDSSGGKYGGMYEALLVDFGIAKLVDMGDADRQRLTATGQVFGTPYYMSPEQCLGNSLDARSDIYSFGCKFFQALTGRLPFQGATALETVMMHLHEEPPTLKAAAAVYSSPELESLVAKLLLKDRERRYGSMGQVIHDLERIRAQKPIAGTARSIGFESSPVRPAPKSQTDAVSSPENTSTSKASIGLIAAGGALLLLLLAVPCFLFFGPKSPPSEEAVPMQPLSNLLPDEAKIENPERKVTALASFVTADVSAVDKNVRAYLASGTKVTYSLSADGKNKVIHCPPFSVGKLRWCTTGSPTRRFDSQSDGKAAVGDVSVPADKWTIICLDPYLDSMVWRNPEILKCFDTAGIVGVKIKSSDLSDHVADNSQIIEALRGWSELRSVVLVDGQISEAALKSLDAHKTLQELSLCGSNVKASALQKLKCLQVLSVVKLIQFKDLDDLLPVLSGNKELQSIYISKATPLPSGKVFASLRSCKRLQIIELSDCHVNDESLDAITNNLPISFLRLIVCKGVTAKKILAIAGKHKDLNITVKVPSQDSDVIEEFKAAFAGVRNIELQYKRDLSE